jgi:DNA polymerase-3 subunit epsilon
VYGPFSSHRAARETLRDLADEAALCWRLLGLERRAGPCFARQIKRCAGACVGAETPEAHHQRFRQALEPYALRQWPYEGLISIQETSLTGERTDVHLFRDWCWLGTATDGLPADCSKRRAGRLRLGHLSHSLRGSRGSKCTLSLTRRQQRIRLELWRSKKSAKLRRRYT